MKKMEDFLTLKQDGQTTIIDVFKEMSLQDLAALQLEKQYGYWKFSLRDTDEKFQKVVFTEDDVNYILILNSDDVITFIKAFPKDKGTYEIGLSYGTDSVMYYEFFHDVNRSTNCITQLNIDKSKCSKFDQQGKTSSSKIENFYDYSKLFNLITEFQQLNNKYFTFLMKDHLTLSDKLGQIVK